eukprot:4740701-Amphidinium_carterae.1
MATLEQIRELVERVQAVEGREAEGIARELSFGSERRFALYRVFPHLLTEAHWQAAVQRNPNAILIASDELLLDSTFAPEEKRDFYILKISMLSGRSLVVLAASWDSTESVVEKCCDRFGIRRRGTERLVYGTEVVPERAQVIDWPGLRPQGEVSECQLVLGAVESSTS